MTGKEKDPEKEIPPPQKKKRTAPSKNRTPAAGVKAHTLTPRQHNRLHS